MSALDMAAELDDVALVAADASECERLLKKEAAKRQPVQQEVVQKDVKQFGSPCKRTLVKCLSSPSQIAALYAGSSARVKVTHCMCMVCIYTCMPAQTPRRHMPPHFMCVWCAYIHDQHKHPGGICLLSMRVTTHIGGI